MTFITDITEIHFTQTLREFFGKSLHNLVQMLLLQGAERQWLQVTSQSNNNDEHKLHLLSALLILHVLLKFIYHFCQRTGHSIPHNKRGI